MEINKLTAASHVRIVGVRGAWAIQADGQLVTNNNGPRRFRTLDACLRAVTGRVGVRPVEVIPEAG